MLCLITCSYLRRYNEPHQRSPRLEKSRYRQKVEEKYKEKERLRAQEWEMGRQKKEKKELDESLR